MYRPASFQPFRTVYLLALRDAKGIGKAKEYRALALLATYYIYITVAFMPFI